jgi:hypothetical protein
VKESVIMRTPSVLPIGVAAAAFAATLATAPSTYAADTKAAVKVPGALTLDPHTLSSQDLAKLPAGQVLESQWQKMTAGELQARRLKLEQTRDARIVQLNKAGYARFTQTKQQFLASQLSKLQTESQQAFQAFKSSHPGGVTKN